jgi:Dolichyl-phosphate-mannose-protein mannosyltransferase
VRVAIGFNWASLATRLEPHATGWHNLPPSFIRLSFSKMTNQAQGGAGMQRQLTFSALLPRCAIVLLSLIAYHFILVFLMLRCGLRLGAVSYRLAPLYAYWRPHLKLWLILPLAVLATTIVFLRRTRAATSLSDRTSISVFSALSLAITVSVALSDGGPRSIIAPLLRADLEYIGAVDRVQGIAQFLRDYPSLAETMPMHAQVHPPGPILFVWMSCRLFGAGPWGAAIGIILFSVLAVPFVYRWADRIGGPGVARRATAIFVLTPSVVLFTATSMDAPFAVLLIATMAIYWESMEHRPILLGILAGLAASLSALMTYSVTVALLFCGVASCVRYTLIPEQRRGVVTAACCALATFLAANALLWLFSGYDPTAMFIAAVNNHKHIMSGTRHETVGRYAHLAIANLTVFFIAAGIPCAVLWWSAIPRSVGAVWHLLRGGSVTAEPPSMRTQCKSNDRQLHCLTVAAIITLLVAAVVPVYVLEVERIWMFLVPLVAIPVGRRLFEEDRGTGKVRATAAVATLVAAQTLVTEMLFSTYW